jgi:hypothetical protein
MIAVPGSTPAAEGSGFCFCMERYSALERGEEILLPHNYCRGVRMSLPFECEFMIP